MFYTKKISDTENDVLHNESGPALVFANDQGEYDQEDPKLAFYFLDDVKVDHNSKQWHDAYRASAGKTMADTEVKDKDVAGGYDFDNM